MNRMLSDKLKLDVTTPPSNPITQGNVPQKNNDGSEPPSPPSKNVSGTMDSPNNPTPPKYLTDEEICQRVIDPRSKEIYPKVYNALIESGEIPEKKKGLLDAYNKYQGMRFQEFINGPSLFARSNGKKQEECKEPYRNDPLWNLLEKGGPGEKIYIVATQDVHDKARKVTGNSIKLIAPDIGELVANPEADIMKHLPGALLEGAALYTGVKWVKQIYSGTRLLYDNAQNYRLTRSLEGSVPIKTTQEGVTVLSPPVTQQTTNYVINVPQVISSTTQIRTDWVLPEKGGAIINGRWYTEHALERMAPKTPQVMAELENRTLQRIEAKGYKRQTDAFGKEWTKYKPDPRNIPPSVVEAEITNPGSTNIRVELNENGDVITVIPRG